MGSRDWGVGSSDEGLGTGGARLAVEDVLPDGELGGALADLVRVEVGVREGWG